MAVYAFSDLHGRYDLWTKICAAVQPDDTLICLGDNIDRGPDGIKIYLEQKARPHTIIIKGNHEDIAANAIFSRNYHDWHLWEMNGGQATANYLEDHFTEEEINNIGKEFKDLPKKYIATFNTHEVICDHAGFNPDGEQWSEPFWDRSHFYTPHWFGEDNLYLVHGHTPVPYLADWLGLEVKAEWTDVNNNIKPKLIRYCDNHKFDIDLGSVATNRTVLLNLETFEPIYLEVE